MKKILVYMINIYRNYLSHLKLQSCRFHPTCSEYAAGAIEKNGVVKGLLASAKRILRCHPFSSGGHDPVK